MSVLPDTNVVSELIRKTPEPSIETWARGLPLEPMFFSAVGEAELQYGAAILPTGRHRDRLVNDMGRMLRDAFEDRVLPFESNAAWEYACIVAVRRSIGRMVMPTDLQIAAIARSCGLAVATRNVRDFADTGV